MEREEIRTIIKTRFPGEGDEFVYCIHCLNPFLGEQTKENEHLSISGFGTASSAETRTRELMYRAMPELFGDPESIRRQPHQCGQCEFWNQGSSTRPGTTGEVFLQETSVICCPHCLMPIHRGEGPYTPEGYRAELLRRATGGSFTITQEMFDGEMMEPAGSSGLHISPPIMAWV